MYPTKRQSGLSVQPMGDELVVIDLERRDVFRLNATAALLWERCDGSTSVRELAAFLRNTLDPDVDEASVWSSLHDLSDSGLLETPLPAEPGGISRRTLLATVALIGGAGVIAPLVRGAVPAAAAPAAKTISWKMGAAFLIFGSDPASQVKLAFSHIEGLGAETEVTYPAGNAGGNPARVPGASKWAPIVLKRGMTSDQVLWKWQQQVVNGDQKAIKQLKVSVLDASGNEQLGWNLTNAWPDKLTVLPADAGDVVYEQVEIVPEKSERYK